VFLLFAFFVLCPVFPVNYFGEKIWLKQPDGTKVEVCVFGNEFYQDVETPDGYTLIRDEVSGEICYALVSSDQMEYASSGIKYQGGETPASVKKIVNQHARISPQSIKTKISEKQKQLGFDKDKMAGSDKIELRTASILPDTIYGIVILLDFKDVKSDVTKEQVEKFCNGDNYNEFGNSRSVKEYYQWISGGKLTYINYVTDFVTMPQNKSVYDNEKYDPWMDNLKLGFLDTISNVVLSDRFVEKSKLTKISSQIGSNYYLVNVFYAGFPECGWSKGLWPHMSSGGLTIDPKRVKENPYQMSDLGDELTVGCFIHETAHLVCGWPDFYSYDGLEVNNNNYGLGTQWFVSSTKNPLAPSPYCLDMMGWTEKINITDLKNGELVTLKKEVGNVAVYYGSQETGSSNERYYLEVRDEAPEFMYGKQLKGLFIWHVNELGSNEYSIFSNGIQLEDCRPATYDDPCFKKGLKTEFNDEGEPSAKWDSGENSGLDIWDISEAGEKMTFRCGRAIDSIQDLSVSQTKGLLNLPFQAQVLSLTNPNQQGELRFRLSKGTLPTGLIFSSEGVITGIPLEQGIFSFTIDAFFSTEIIKSQTLTIEILDLANLEGFKGTVNLPDTIEIEDFILGGEGVAYHDNGIGNGNFDTSSVYRPDEDVDITLNKRTGQYGVLFEKGEWTRYVVNVETEGWYKLTINFDSLYDTRNRDLLILLNEKDTLVNSIYDNVIDNMLLFWELEYDDNDQLHFLVNLPKGRHCLKFLARKMMSVDNIIMKKIDYKEGERTPFNGTPISIPGEFNFYDFDYNGIEMDPYYRQYLNDCESRYYRNDLICSRLFQYPNKLSYSISVKETGWYYLGEYININNYGGQPALSIDGSPVLVKIFEEEPEYSLLKALYVYLPIGDWTLTMTNVEPFKSKNNVVKYDKVHKVVLLEDSIVHIAKYYEKHLLEVFSPISDCKITTRGLGKDSLSSGLPKGMKVLSGKEYNPGCLYGGDFYEYYSPNLFLLVGIPEETGDFEFEVIISDSLGNIEKDTFHLDVQGIKDFKTQIFIRDRYVSVDLPINLNLEFRTLADRAVQMGS
jgi:M6 family metalloprotease-like protein